MKFSCGLLFFIFWILPNCFSQIGDNNAIQLGKLPAEGVLLDKDWKFHAGDDFAWASPELNDEGWEQIDPAIDIRHIPQFQNTSIGWLRLKLQVDSFLLDQPLGILLSQVGASEIYLDGQLMYKFGTVSAAYEKEQTHFLFNRPFSLKLNTRQFHTISVRYSFSKKNFLVPSEYQNYCLRIILNKVDKSFSSYQAGADYQMIIEISQIALWLLLSLLCFGLFFSFRSQIAYLYIGVYSFLLALGGLLGGLIARELTSTSFVGSVLFLAVTLNMISVIFFFNGLYPLLNSKKNWLYYCLMSFGVIVISSYFLFYDYAFHLYGLFFILVGIVIFPESYKAMRRKRPGAPILFATSLFFFICIICAFIGFDYLKSLRVGHLFAFLGVACTPIFWSLFMAGEYARTGIALQARVKEVEHLSQKAIAQEQEKQQILKSQNTTLESKVAERTAELNQSLKNLQSTQTQLIQSEKMASLGELTAGIAHEIQNPLNFINNFSEVNKELLTEMNGEIDKGNSNEVKIIANDVIENEGKINQHGRRVDAIVKNMLQHSRETSGQKESTDINVLADEYLRLSYHGLKAKDKSFNASVQTNFDPDLGNIRIVPQDISRVLINLYNNAFYAISTKKKQQPEGYEPMILVSTRKENGIVEVSVKDNGNGIPQKLIDKIFQPFFTTKPTGQGTGLGLSLSYDIIKAHGGEIRVETKEGEGSEFNIQLPVV